MLLALVLLAAVPRIGVIVADADQRSVLDEVAASKRFVAVPPAEMKKHLDAASSLGIKCALDDAACLARVAAFAKTPFLLVVSSSDAQASVTFIEAATSKSRTVNGALSKERTAALRALVASALSDVAAPNPTPPPQPPTSTSTPTPTPTTPTTPTTPPTAPTQTTTATPASTPTPPASTPALVYAGGAVAGAGAVAAVGALVAAVVVTPDPARRGAYSAKEFNDGVAAGQRLYVAAAVAGAVVVVGGAVAAVGLVE